MTDPKNKTEPASNHDEELQYKVSLISLTVFHLGKAKYYSQKSKCAECGSDKGIEFDFPNTEDEMEQIASGIVIGRCAHCGESTAIGLHYSPMMWNLRIQRYSVYQEALSKIHSI